MPTEHASPKPGEATVDDRARSRPSLWVPVLLNLLLGVPALAPLYCAQWLLTKYLPMDCRSSADIAQATNCNYHTLDHAGPMMMILTLSGIVVLTLAMVVNNARPLAPGRRLRSWLGATALLLVPYTAIWTLYLSGLGR
jgi:hypothetical protein